MRFPWHEPLAPAERKIRRWVIGVCLTALALMAAYAKWGF